LHPPPSFATVQAESVQERVARLEPISLRTGERTVSEKLLGGAFDRLPWGRFTTKAVSKAEMVRSVTAKFSGAVANSFVETGRAALMIWVVTCMATLDTIKREYKNRQIKFEGSTLRESIQICSNVLINSGEIHAGMCRNSSVGIPEKNTNRDL